MKKSLLMLCALAFSALASMAQVTGVVVEEFYTDDATVAGYPAGHTTYRIYATTTNANDAVIAVVGFNEAPLALNVPDGIWNQPEPSGIVGTDNNCNLYGTFPSLQYDSYVTIGRTCNTDAGGQLFTFEDAAQAWRVGSFDTSPYGNGNILLNTTVGGAWNSLPSVGGIPYENTIAGADLKVLLAQITTTGSICGSFNVQCTPEGSATAELYSGLSFGTGGCGLPGCADPAALNYNMNAGFNDGSCLFPCTLEFITTEFTNPTCPGETDGSVVFQASGAQDLIEYSFNGGDSFVSSAEETESGLGAGIYEIMALDRKFYNEVFNPGGIYGTCEVITSVFLEEFPIIFEGVTPSNITCNGNNDGCALSSVIGGVGTLMINIVDESTGDLVTDDSGSVVELPSPDYCGLLAGDYHFMATDENGCTQASESFSITEPLALTLFTGANAPSSCSDTADGVQVITWSGGTGDVDWSLEDDGTYDLEGGPSTLVLNTLAPGAYTVYARDVNFCTASISFAVVGPAAIVIEPVVTLASCTGSDDATITVTSTGGEGSINYSFDCSGVYSSQDFFGPFAPGMYTICAEDANGCTSTVEVEVVDQTPVTATFDVSNIACFGSSDASFEVIAEGGVGGYTYSTNGIDFTTDPLFTNVEVGTYTIIVRDANNCQVEYADAVNIFEPSAVEATVATTDVDCFGDATGSIVINATGGTEPFSYNIGGFSQPSNTFNGVEAGSYTVTVTDNNGCEYSENVTISGPASALSVVVDGFGGQDADGGFINVTATGGTPSYGYDWTGTGGFTSPNEDLTGLSAGTYSLTVTDANGCEASITSDVIITGVGELSNQIALSLNPNPTRENVVLTLSGLTGDKLSYNVVDTQGRTVVSKELGNVNGVRIETIDLSNVAAGVYYVNVTIDGNVSIMKLIKQ
jgi:hypothetical protein